MYQYYIIVSAVADVGREAVIGRPPPYGLFATTCKPPHGSG